MRHISDGAGNQIPSRDDLFHQLEIANRNAKIWVAVQALAVIVVVLFIDWPAAMAAPILTTVAIGMMVGPTATELARLWAQNKREIGDLKEDTRFGVFDKHRLRMLYRDTVQRLGLPDQRLPVYITADKSLNASALRLGLGAFFKSLNGIYLNRQVLHRLTPEEVQDIMGHELGHYYRYYLVSDRFRSLNMVLGALLGLLVAQWTGMESIFSVVISFALATGFWTLSGMLWSKHGQTIEYLCDDLGAQVHGVHVSINGLLKLGVDAETMLEIRHQTLLSKQKGNLSPRAVVEAVEAAIPYGSSSREELEKAVTRSLAKTAEKENRLSIAGFLDYAWNSENHADIDEQLEEQAKKMQVLQSVPRIDWESLLQNRNEICFYDHDLPRLIELIQTRPEAALFRLPQEIGAVEDVHPPLKNRILYLWHNRDEIQRAARSAYRYT
ncbi:MAG: M48 family metalloprotease [Planctomycetales bacterium]|nr:M48 family metalloprotease [Planctomycetales bacterium]